MAISTFTVDGKPQRHSTRVFTLGYLASVTIGGKGATAKLREMLAEAGIEDPTHTSWTLTLPSGKTVGAVKDGDPLPELPAKSAKKTVSKGKAADRIVTLNAKKAAAKAARDAGHPIPDSTLAAMDAATAVKVEQARLTRRAPAAKAS